MEYFYGKTVDSAIEEGLKELGLTKENAVITIIEESSKGVLGIGGKKAKVGIEKKLSDGDCVNQFLTGLFDILDITAKLDIVENEEKISIDIITDSSSALIGYRGEILDALQTLSSAVANLGKDNYKRVTLNCENYRQKREETLTALAHRLANKALKTSRNVTLEPMNPFERRIIHSALSEVEHISTESFGVEPKRYIVIKPDNAKPYERSRNYKKDGKNRQNGFKSEMIRTTQKTSGFGTFLGNSLKKD